VEPRIGWRDLRRVLAYLAGARLAFAVSLALLLCISALTAAKAWILQPVVDAFLADEASRDRLLLLCLVVAGIFVLQALLSWAYVVLARTAGSRLVASLRAALFRRLLGQGLGYFAARPSSDVASRVVNDVYAFEFAAIGSFQGLLRDVTTLLFLAAVLLAQDLTVALLVFAVLAVAMVALRLLNRRVARTSRAVQESLSGILRHMNEMIAGIEVVVSLGLARRWRDRFEKTNRENYAAYVRAHRTAATSSTAVRVIVGLGLGGILFLTGDALLRGRITPGEFSAMLAAIYLMQTPAVGIGSGVTALTQGLAAGARALEILDETKEAEDAPSLVPAGEGRLAFDGVGFGYGEEPAVRDLSFVVEPGELVVVVGDSGAGKTTLARLALRFFDPESGRVLLDGQDLRACARDGLYEVVSYVAQEVFLFDDTVAANLRLGRPEATEAELRDAIAVACLEEFVARLPEGLATEAGERGVRMSGGERQRIAIARAVLTGARVLVLDEATSALDVDLERRVLKNLAGLERTILAISHRPAVAQVADKVLVLKAGRLIEQGTEADLRAAAGEYTRLASSLDR